MSEPILPCVARHEPDAMERCIARYGGLIWSLARRCCNNPTDVEDVVQNIFIELWRSAARYDASLGEELTFVSVIARRRLIDSRRAAYGRRPEPIDQHATACRRSVSAGFNAEDTGRVGLSVSQLSPNEQLVVGLVVARGNTHSSVAASTGLPVGTVKTHARRALIKLRATMSDTPSHPKNGEAFAISPHLTRVA